MFEQHCIAVQVPATREEWLRSRRQGIGGSDVAPILGLSPWRTPLNVWEDKLGLGEDVDETSPALYWGNLLEAPIRQAYADATGMKVTKPAEMFISKEHPFMVANLDGIREDGRLVEFKTTSVGNNWGEPGTDQIPDYYLTQVQHYMAVTGATVCDVAVLIAGRDFRIYTVQADAELQAVLIQREKDFWQLVTSRTAPDPINPDDAARVWTSAIKGKTIDATGDMVAAWARLHQISESIEALEDEESQLKTKIMSFMQDSTSLKHQGKTLCSWSAPSSRKTVDSKKLAAEFPDAYEACLKAGAPRRTFRTY